MRPRLPDLPSQSQLILPLLEVLQEAGGAVRAADACVAIADRTGISDETRRTTASCADGQETNRYTRQIRFARQKALEMGYLRSEGYGLWDLTDEGREGIRHRRRGVIVSVVLSDGGVPAGLTIELAGSIPTLHTIRQGDARDLSYLESGAVPLILASPPYHSLKRYLDAPGQLGSLDSYEEFLEALDPAWLECARVLQPGGHMVCVVGDVLRSRKQHGYHHVLPLCDDVRTRVRRLTGLSALNGYLWKKISNCSFEQSGRGAVLGQPGAPNNVVQLAHERVLVFRKRGPYQSRPADIREASRITPDERARWQREIWDDIPGASTRGMHPAPFPVQLGIRVIRLYSFVGDTVLDPFAGSFTTTVAAMQAHRSSVCADVAHGYVEAGAHRALVEAHRLAA